MRFIIYFENGQYYGVILTFIFETRLCLWLSLTDNGRSIVATIRPTNKRNIRLAKVGESL